MSTDMVTPIDEVLERTSKGQGTFPELARSLKALPHMVILIPPEELSRFMEELETARKQRASKVESGELPPSEPHVTATDVEDPRMMGITTQNGEFLPRIFTNDQIAREYAVGSGLIEPESVCPFLTKSWSAGLKEFLVNGFAGVIINDGSEHKVSLDRSSVARLFGYLTFKEFATLPFLHAVTHHERLHYQRTPGGEVQAFVYDNEEVASQGILQLQKDAAGVGIQKMPSAELLLTLLRAGVTSLVVNHAVADEHSYNRDDLVNMVETRGNGELPVGVKADTAVPQLTIVEPALEPQPGPEPETSTAPSTTGDTTDGLPKIAQKVLAHLTLPVIPPPEQTDADAQKTFLLWKKKHDQGHIETHQFLETLAFQLKLYTLVHPRPVDGLTWPQCFRAPEDESQTITYLFTTETMIPKALEKDSPETVTYQALSGIEALRWIWSTPKAIDLIAIDYDPDDPSSMTFPSYWALSAIYPLFYEISDLQKMPNVGPAKLGSLPGARGLKPEAVKALVDSWKQLIGLQGEGDTSPMFNLDEKCYLPLFSDADQFFAFTSASQGLAGKPKPHSGNEAPFRRWLEETADGDGVILDPAGPWPLVLDHTDLLLLDLWSKQTEVGPGGSDIVSSIARLLDEERISAPLAGRMAADYPRYWIGLQQSPDGSKALLTVPQTSACALFTSQDLAQSFLESCRSNNKKAQLEGMKPMPILTRWHTSALAMATEQFSGAWIDPDPQRTSGLLLGREALEAALARIDEKLKPRVPGFIWEI